MPGAVAADMGDGLVHPVHQLGRDDHVEELAAEVLGRGPHRAGDLAELALGPHLDARASSRSSISGAPCWV